MTAPYVCTGDSIEGEDHTVDVPSDDLCDSGSPASLGLKCPQTIIKVGHDGTPRPRLAAEEVRTRSLTKARAPGCSQSMTSPEETAAVSWGLIIAMAEQGELDDDDIDHCTPDVVDGGIPLPCGKQVDADEARVAVLGAVDAVEFSARHLQSPANATPARQRHQQACWQRSTPPSQQLQEKEKELTSVTPKGNACLRHSCALSAQQPVYNTAPRSLSHEILVDLDAGSRSSHMLMNLRHSGQEALNNRDEAAVETVVTSPSVATGGSPDSIAASTASPEQRSSRRCSSIPALARRSYKEPSLKGQVCRGKESYNKAGQTL